MDVEDVNLLEECFIQEGILFDISSVEDLESAYEDVTCRTISSLQQAVEELVVTGEEVRGKSNCFEKKFILFSFQVLNPEKNYDRGKR